MSLMIPRTQPADVARLYDEAQAEDALVEIELDTRQLRAITMEDAARSDEMRNGDIPDLPAADQGCPQSAFDLFSPR
jgi:hypothetical protein